MVTKLLSALFFVCAALLLILFAVLAAFAISGALYDCGDGGAICRDAMGAVYIGLILMAAAAVSFFIGLWIRKGG